MLLAPATEALLWEGGGGRRSFSQETCLLLVQERTAPDHEELVVPKSLWIMGLFVLPFRKQKGLFCLRKTPFQSLVQGDANCSIRTKRKGIYHEKTQHPQGCCRPDCPGSVRRCAQRLRRRRIQHRFQRSKFFCRCQQRSIRRGRRRGCRKERGRPDRCHLCTGAQRQHRRAVCCCQGCLGRLDRRSEGAGGRRKC